MRDILTVFRFTLRDGLRKKAFILTTVLVLVVILIVCCLPSLLTGDSSSSVPPAGGEEVPKSETCYVLDEAEAVPGVMEALTAVFPQVDFQKGAADKLNDYRTEVENDQSVSILQISKGESLPSLTLYTTDFSSGLPSSTVAEVVRSTYASQVLSAAGVSQETAEQVLTPLTCDTVMVGKMDLSGYVLGIALTLIMFFAVYYYGYGVAMSVASEKTSRVMETLVVSAKPSRILLGKCLGMGVLGLIQLSLFLLAGAVGFLFLVPADFTIMGMPLALSSFTVTSALLTLLYFVLGYTLYAMLNSVCGATVSRAEDLNAAMMPTILVSMVSFYAAYMAILVPEEGLRRIVTYIPFTSPFVMPFRLLNESVPATDILLSVVFLLAAIALITTLSIRIYSASVLHYGQRLKLKDLLKLHT